MILDRKIWAVASGKGGTGKTVLAASMAAHLADLGFRVVVVDADLGCANLHTCFDMEKPKSTLADFIQRRTEHIEEVAVETGIPNLRIISGALDPMTASLIRYQQKRRIIRQLNTLEADVVILDLATGSGLTHMELLSASDLGVMVVVPEPTALENFYRLLRMLYFYRVSQLQGWKKFEKKLPKDILNGYPSPVEFISQVENIDPQWTTRILKRVAGMIPGIVVNQVRSKEDRALGSQIMMAGKIYFGLKTPFLGAIEYDDCVWQSVRHRKPVILDYPHSRPSRSIRQVTEIMLSLSKRRT